MEIIEGIIMKPKRIQRKRTKGWKMPENTVYVGRPTKFGNPFTVGVDCANAETAVMLYEMWLKSRKPDDLSFILRMLRGKNLACWCKIGDPCHADVLLELANE